MSMDNNVDYQVKPDLLKDMFRMLKVEPYEEYQVTMILIIKLFIGKTKES
jgi:hypothetical protein